MKRTEVIALLNTYEDVAVYEQSNGNIRATVLDFDGFDEDWNEVMLDYDEDAIDEMQERLYQAANEVEPGFSTCYHFDGFTVTVDWASDDI